MKKKRAEQVNPKPKFSALKKLYKYKNFQKIRTTKNISADVNAQNCCRNTSQVHLKFNKNYKMLLRKYLVFKHKYK
jgi:hypothetical protein